MRGPHDRQFHALWNQLRDEHEELVMKGYTGEGFLSQGKRLGGSRIPLDEVRRQARAAAEQRKVLAKNSGKKLGGAAVLRGTDMRKLRADAAQRRIEVTNGCASGTDHDELAEEASRNGFRTKAEEDDANEQAILQAFIELIQDEEREKYGDSYIPPSQENPAGPRTGEKSDPFETTGPVKNFESGFLPEQTLDTIDSTADNSSYESPWTCTTCTLENPPNFLCCDVCAAERPVPSVTKRPLPSVPKPTATPRQHTPAVGPKPQPKTSNKRVLEADVEEEKDEATPKNNFAFKNRTRALDTLASIQRDTNKRPLGWLCDQCGSFMESQWWTCSCCGKMKPSS